MKQFTIHFPPDFDGCLIVKYETVSKVAVKFDLTFNLRPNENERDAFLRMCREVAQTGR